MLLVAFFFFKQFQGGPQFIFNIKDAKANVNRMEKLKLLSVGLHTQSLHLKQLCIQFSPATHLLTFLLCCQCQLVASCSHHILIKEASTLSRNILYKRCVMPSCHCSCIRSITMLRLLQYNLFLSLQSYIPDKVYLAGIPVPLRELDLPTQIQICTFLMKRRLIFLIDFQVDLLFRTGIKKNGCRQVPHYIHFQC